MFDTDMVTRLINIYITDHLDEIDDGTMITSSNNRKDYNSSVIRYVGEDQLLQLDRKKGILSVIF